VWWPSSCATAIDVDALEVTSGPALVMLTPKSDRQDEAGGATTDKLLTTILNPPSQGVTQVP
jgi:hypothetical protein